MSHNDFFRRLYCMIHKKSHFVNKLNEFGFGDLYGRNMGNVMFTFVIDLDRDDYRKYKSRCTIDTKMEDRITSKIILSLLTDEDFQDVDDIDDVHLQYEDVHK